MHVLREIWLSSPDWRLCPHITFASNICSSPVYSPTVFDWSWLRLTVHVWTAAAGSPRLNRYSKEWFAMCARLETSSEPYGSWLTMRPAWNYDVIPQPSGVWQFASTWIVGVRIFWDRKGILLRVDSEFTDGWYDETKHLLEWTCQRYTTTLKITVMMMMKKTK